MEQQRAHKTYKYKLAPTPAQTLELEFVLSCCRTLYTVALEQRTTWWQRRQGKSATYYQQAMELPDLKVACPEYAEINAQVLQDVLRRLERTFQAFFRRVQAGETPGYPRFQGRGRHNRSSFRSMAMALCRTVVFSASPRLGASASGCIFPWKASPRPLPSAGKWMAGTPASPAPTCRYSRCRPQDRGRG